MRYLLIKNAGRTPWDTPCWMAIVIAEKTGESTVTIARLPDVLLQATPRHSNDDSSQPQHPIDFRGRPRNWFEEHGLTVPEADTDH